MAAAMSVCVGPQLRATYSAGASMSSGPFITGQRPAVDDISIEPTLSAEIRLPAGNSRAAHSAAARASGSIDRESAATR
jgi:hypothetical protein